MVMKGIEFEDAQVPALEGETLQVPTLDVAMAVKVNQRIQVCTNGERLWLIVRGIVNHKAEPEYLGEIVEDPVFDITRAKGLAKGRCVWVEPRNIYQIGQ